MVENIGQNSQFNAEFAELKNNFVAAL